MNIMINSEDEHKKPEDKTHGLVKARSDAIKRTDGLTYYLINKTLGFTPEESLVELNEEGLRTYNSDPIEGERLEREILEIYYGEDYFTQNTKKITALEPQNNNVNFGIKGKDVIQLPEHTVIQIWSGMNNFFCPELFPYMNPAEILGLYAGIASKSEVSKVQLKKETIAETLSNIVSRGYKISMQSVNLKHNDIDLLELAKKLETSSDYENTSGLMKQRLKLLHPEIKEEIITQLSAAPAKHVYDPNSDALHHTKKPYQQLIDNHIYAVYAAHLSHTKNK